MSPEEYVESRIDDQIDWYNKKSGINKRYHHLSNVLVIVFSAIIPFATGLQTMKYPWMSYVIGFLGLIIGVITGISTLYKFLDKWSNYRKTAELLTHEKFLFQTSSGPYSNHKAPFKLFAYRAENIMSEEVASWSKYMVNQEENE